MYTSGSIIDLSKEDKQRFGLVLDSTDTCVKYLDITTEIEDEDKQKGIYVLIKDSFALDRPIQDSLYLHLDVIHIADGEFKLCGRLNSNKDFIDVMSYFNGYKTYVNMLREQEELKSINLPGADGSISLRKTP